jgi:hypothetical protein
MSMGERLPALPPPQQNKTPRDFFPSSNHSTISPASTNNNPPTPQNTQPPEPNTQHQQPQPLLARPGRLHLGRLHPRQQPSVVINRLLPCPPRRHCRRAGGQSLHPRLEPAAVQALGEGKGVDLGQVGEDDEEALDEGREADLACLVGGVVCVCVCVCV